MGAEAILTLLKRIDLDALADELKKELEASQGQKKAKIIKRLEIVEAFIQGKTAYPPAGMMGRLLLRPGILSLPPASMVFPPLTISNSGKIILPVFPGNVNLDWEGFGS